jgi:hypothetical protein
MRNVRRSDTERRYCSRRPTYTFHELVKEMVAHDMEMLRSGTRSLMAVT